MGNERDERESEIFVLSSHPRMSGRGVRLLALLPSETDAVAKAAAIASGNSAADFRHAQLRIGVARCLKGITRGRVPMLERPVLKDGKPVTRPVKDENGQPKKDAHGHFVTEPVTAPQADTAWLADDKNWVKPDPIQIEMDYDRFVQNAKDDNWLCVWWIETHEVNPETVQRIMEKGLRVSSG